MAYHHTQSPHLTSTVNLKAAYEILLSSDNQTTSLDALEPYESSNHQKVFEEWPLWLLDEWTPAHLSVEAMDYLVAGRVEIGAQPVTHQQAKKAGLRYDAKHHRIVAPFYNAFGKFAGARGRSTNNHNKKGKHYDYRWQDNSNTSLVWYGEEALNEMGILVITEGQFDCIHLRQVYSKVVANLTAKPSKAKMMKALQSPAIILMMDNDQTGKQVVGKYLEYAEKFEVPMGVLSYPEKYKDPASIPLEEVVELFKQAELIT